MSTAEPTEREKLTEAASSVATEALWECLPESYNDHDRALLGAWMHEAVVPAVLAWMEQEGYRPPLADWEKELADDTVRKYTESDVVDYLAAARERYEALVPDVQLRAAYQLGYDDGWMDNEIGDEYRAVSKSAQVSTRLAQRTEES